MLVLSLTARGLLVDSALGEAGESVGAVGGGGSADWERRWRERNF